MKIEVGHLILRRPIEEVPSLKSGMGRKGGLLRGWGRRTGGAVYLKLFIDKAGYTAQDAPSMRSFHLRK